MCGIAGILSLDGSPVAVEEVERMCAALVHRGPDDLGLYQSGPAALGMRRLSIIDLETGKQPVRNEDGSIWAVFNGEIYNFRELRRDLEGRGHSFYTRTDTETIVHLYEEYGPRCAEWMRGMFAFAVWDERRQHLLLARDRLGIKPLYYGEVGGRLIFASELKAILELPEVERRINWRSVNHVFTFLSTPAAESIVESVNKLEPGHILSASPGRGLRVSSYWDLSVAPEYGRTEDEVVEGLRAALQESVRLHLMSDVPLGAFLSGGIDSSSVVATMAPLMSRPVQTFSIGFREAAYNELGYARLASQSLGTEHHELILEPDVVQIIEDLAWYLDEPFGDTSAIPTYMVSKLASEHVKVVLSGDGGDELFAGYDRYRVEQRERTYELLPAPARSLLGMVGRLAPEGMKGRNFLRHIALSGGERYLDASTLFRRDGKEKLFQPEALALLSEYDPWREAAGYLAKANGHWLSALQYLDFKSYLPLDILPKVDRMSMAHSIEARVPLLDHELVEFVARIPPELKLGHGTAKYIFKRAMRGVLPDAILDRPKQGFVIPLGHWFTGRLEEFVRDLLLSETTRQRGIFNQAYIENLLNWCRKGRHLDTQIWTLISFELWCRTFLDRRPARARVEAGAECRPTVVVGPGL
jgi:asparagine synthase (glutamine-hydrolysing)